MAETLYATSALAGNATSPDNALGPPDGVYTNDAGNVTWNERWALGDPVGTLAGTQTILATIRKSTTGGNNPTVVIALYENATLVSTLFNATISDATTFVEVTFDASAISDKTLVEIYISSTPAGGSGATKRCAHVDAITWTANVAAPSTNLTVDDATQTHIADTVTVTQVHELTATEAAQAHTADSPSLTQIHQLAVADAVHAHVADNITLGTSAPVNLTVADTAHPHTADSPTLTQVHNLVVQDATHAHTADSPTLNSGAQLAAADAVHQQSADTLTLTQVHTLAVADATQAHTAQTLTLTQLHQLVVDDTIHDHTATAVLLDVPAPYEPILVGLDGATTASGIDSHSHADSTLEGTSTSRADIGGTLTATSTDATTTATGHLG